MKTKLPVLSAGEVIKVLEKKNFYFVSQKGSHIKLKKDLEGRQLIVTVPLHKEIRKGVLLNIIKQAELTKEEFLDLVKK